MAVFKIIGSIIKTIENREGKREDIIKDGQYRLVRLPGIKPPHIQPEQFKLGLMRSIIKAAKEIGFTLEKDIITAFVCNDSDSTNALPIPASFNAAEYDD